jgi:hypothetical protein
MMPVNEAEDLFRFWDKAPRDIVNERSLIFIGPYGEILARNSAQGDFSVANYEKCF